MRTLLAAAILALVAIPALADFNAEVTASPDFAAGLKRVAVVAVGCHESVDCTQVEDAAAEELTERRPGFEVLPRAALRDELFAGGSRRSEVRVEVRLVARDGALRMSGRGSGRPKNVVSGTERVAGTVIEKILLKAFGTRGAGPAPFLVHFRGGGECARPQRAGSGRGLLSHRRRQ